MAQPKRPEPRSGEPASADDKLRDEFENLEKKFRDHIGRRNELNDQARALRADRDLLNASRREFSGKMQELAARRDALNAEMRKHKALRNEAQAQAKALIATKSSKREKGTASRSSVLHSRELKAKIADMEFKHQTTPMEIAKEREFLKKLRALTVELAGLQKEVQEYRDLKVDLSDTDKAIDTLFARADEEHKLVEKYYAEASAMHAEFVKVLEEAAVIGAEANNKHKDHIAARERAQAEHEKASQLREQLLTMKGELYKSRQEARDAIRQTQRDVRDNLLDKGKLDERAEDTLEQLKKGGKITLG